MNCLKLQAFNALPQAKKHFVGMRRNKDRKAEDKDPEDSSPPPDLRRVKQFFMSSAPMVSNPAPARLDPSPSVPVAPLPPQFYSPPVPSAPPAPTSPSNRTVQLIYDLLESALKLPTEQSKGVLKSYFKLIKTEINEIPEYDSRKRAYDLVQGYKRLFADASSFNKSNLLEFSELTVTILGCKAEIARTFTFEWVQKSIDEALVKSFNSIKKLCTEMASKELEAKLAVVDAKYIILRRQPSNDSRVIELLELLCEVDALKQWALERYEIYIRSVEDELRSKALQIENAYNRILVTFGRYIPDALCDFVQSTKPLSYSSSITNSLNSISELSERLEALSTAFPEALEELLEEKPRRVRGN
mmetsp:Transcript_18747/g.33996  ORF Transcript_18747/g.33996 Transcript_18747/m.33996 type:complete len:359 (-) Transcript_18747:56-1132(-)